MNTRAEMTFIAIDIGTSFIKGAILDLDALRLQHIQRVPFPGFIPGLPPLYREVDPQAILNAVNRLLDGLLPLAGDAQGLVMCSQMHTLIFTNEHGEALTNLVSWQDQRVLMPHPSGNGSYFDLLKDRIQPADQRLLGNELRPGQPIGLLFWLAEQSLLPGGDSFPASLPDFVIANLSGAPPVTEITHGMSHGALNLETGDWHYAVLSELGVDDLHWPNVQPQGTVAGFLTHAGQKIPCYTPVGDYQAALAGALLRPGELSLNISTGSQVSLLQPAADFGDFQTRPFFDGWFLRTITHIPAGRSLNVLVRLLSELADTQGVALSDPWPAIIRAATEAPDSDLRINLAFYNSPVGDHGSITGIREENLTVGHLFRAAFQAMADYYYACALRLSPDQDWRGLVFSGGLAQKIPILRDLIDAKFQAQYRTCPTAEDTLLGLLALALVFSGRLSSVEQAINLLEKSYQEA